MIEDITPEWRKVILPLDLMNREEDFSEAYEFSIVFDEKFIIQRVGRIYIDEFYLYK